MISVYLFSTYFSSLLYEIPIMAMATHVTLTFITDCFKEEKQNLKSKIIPIPND